MLSFRVSTLAVRSMSRALEGAGLDRDLLLRRAGIDAERIEEPDGWVLPPTLFRLWREARALDPAEDLGLRAGAAAPAGVFEVLDYLFSSSATVQDGLQQFQRYFSVAGSNMVGWEIVGPDSPEPRFRFRARVPPKVFPPVMRDYAVSAFVTRLFRWTGGVVPVRVDVRGPGLATLADYRAVLRSSVRLQQAHNEVVLSSADFHRELPQRDPALASLMRRHASHIERSAPDGDFVQLVRREVASELGPGEPPLREVSARLGVSERTMQRRLSEAGTHWSDLVDDERRQMALECLKEPSFSIGEVGLLLGYSEPSAFTRAFKRWTGRSPSSWRRAAKRG